jgi:hypothetical protein
MPRPRSPRPQKVPLDQMTPQEILNRDMDRAEWGPRISKRPIINKKHSEWAKTDEENLRTLARARVGTQIGGPNARYCTATSRSTGKRCGCLALRGEKVCWKHASIISKVRHLDRRRAEGRPVDHAGKLARRNVKTLLKNNLIPYELWQQPAFLAVMQVVAPTWFGLTRHTLGREVTREDLKVASLLSREMVLAWMTAVDTGDMIPWTQVVMKAREAGYIRPVGMVTPGAAH